MKRGRSTGKPTKEEVARFDAIKEAGCVACWIRGFGPVLPEIHHLTVGGKHGQKRRGHAFTIGLCQHHHRGGVLIVGDGLSRIGPSYASEPRRFRGAFGHDDHLLELQNRLIATGSIE